MNIVELMAVVVIILTLLLVAVPVYNDYIITAQEAVDRATARNMSQVLTIASFMGADLSNPDVVRGIIQSKFGYIPTIRSKTGIFEYDLSGNVEFKLDGKNNCGKGVINRK